MQRVGTRPKEKYHSTIRRVHVIPSFRIGAAVRFDPKQVAEWLRRRMPQTVTSPRLSRLAV